MAPRAEDGSLLANSKLANWHRLVSDATERAYRPLAYKTDTRGILTTRGFVDIHEQIIKIPLNSWPTDPLQKDIGRWYNVSIAQGLEAMSLAPLIRMYNWEAEAVIKLCSEVKQEISSKKFRAYCHMLVSPSFVPLHSHYTWRFSHSVANNITEIGTFGQHAALRLPELYGRPYAEKQLLPNVNLVSATQRR